MRDNEPPAPPGSEAGARSGSNGHDLRGRRRCHPCRWGVLGSSLSAHARRGGDVSPPLRAQDPVTGAIRTDPADRAGPRHAGPGQPAGRTCPRSRRRQRPKASTDLSDRRAGCGGWGGGGGMRTSNTSSTMAPPVTRRRRGKGARTPLSRRRPKPQRWRAAAPSKETHLRPRPPFGSRGPPLRLRRRSARGVGAAARPKVLSTALAGAAAGAGSRAV